MILTDSQIILRLEDMFDVKKSEDTTKEELISQVNPNSIDLTISKIYKRPNVINNDVLYGFSCEEERKIYDLAYWSDFVSDNGYITLKPNECLLGVTREYVTMPDNICGQIFTKSTLGRMFINHMMAGVVDAGFHGRLTLELKNDGVHTIRIPVGARIVQMICYKLGETPQRVYSDESRNSRYNGAETVETAKFSVNN